ncbi:signal peptide peptidase SppA [Rhizobium sp. TH2]|uniref:signal peptide peptidase SppA n=1 Tax=Rhizobium sp. TH2 TaxID=2775403 RepID=UPI0021582930|nr:signal peptide peptidase SppA [Rhizobium sp. TH2]UVC09089.1 signal peptide peptidase SppA [Rhizobium sp. TH2]
MAYIDIAERRQLRRKLTFWRVAAFLIIAAAIALVWSALWGGDVGKARDHIARVKISGLIQDDAELLERLDTIAKNDSVKGLIVSIASPGGTTYGGEVIYKAIRKVAEKKPVVSDVRTLAASAGYMIAIGGDHIVAGDTSITGSIGVIFQYPQVKNLLDKIGVSLEEIKSAPLKAEPSPFHFPPPGAKEVIQSMVNDSFDWFVTLVSQRRGIPKAEALKLADGRVFTGRQAKTAKLVDQIGGIKEIRDYLVSKKVGANLPIVDWEPQDNGSPFFLGGLAQDMAEAVGLGWLSKVGSLKNLSEDKLLLDGMVSVWQFDGK